MPLEFVGGKVSGSAGFGAGHFGGGVRSLAGGWRGGVHSIEQDGDCAAECCDADLPGVGAGPVLRWCAVAHSTMGPGRRPPLKLT